MIKFEPKPHQSVSDRYSDMRIGLDWSVIETKVVVYKSVGERKVANIRRNPTTTKKKTFHFISNVKQKRQREKC